MKVTDSKLILGLEHDTPKYVNSNNIQICMLYLLRNIKCRQYDNVTKTQIRPGCLKNIHQ